MSPPSPPSAPPKRPLFIDELPPGGWPRGTMWLSWFGLGLINRAPGTLASFGCLLPASVIVWILGQWALAVAAVFVFVLGYALTAAFERRAGKLDDPQWIVIDEVAGQWATLAIVPLDPVWYALGFGLFRLFDIWKPWPVSWADGKPGAFGLMVDDLLAGFYAGAILWALRFAWLNWIP